MKEKKEKVNTPREQLLESILNAVPVLISFIDPSLRYQFMNEAYQKWFNLKPEEGCGKLMTEVLGKEAYAVLKPYIDRVLTGEFVQFESLIPYENGSRHIDATYIPKFDLEKNFEGFIVLVKDVSSRKNIEKELERFRQKEAVQKSENRYHKMIDEVQDYALLLLSKEGIIENWNKGAEKIKGYKDYEIIGKSFNIFYTPEDQRNKLPQRLIQEAAENGKAIHEGWRVRKDGSYFWGNIIITALHDDDDNVIGFAKVTRDLTELKLADDKLKKHAEQLEFQNKELEQFAYVASHDLQEPLRKIRTFNERILETENLSKGGLDYFGRTISAVNRMQRLIDDLLAYSRATYDIQNSEDVDINQVLDDIMVARKETIDDAGAKFECEKMPRIKSIKFQIWQLFDNLISNAVKYRHPDRTPVIKITCEEVVASSLPHIESTEVRPFYKITITDNGIGFEEQYEEKVFEIFQRLHGHTKLPGSGIGLAICKKIVKNHQGMIYAKSKLDEGTSFFVYLPVTN